MTINLKIQQGWTGMDGCPPLTTKKATKWIKNNNDPAHVRVGIQIYLHRDGRLSTPVHPKPKTLTGGAHEQ
jgi:hypothetical protein